MFTMVLSQSTALFCTLSRRWMRISCDDFLLLTRAEGSSFRLRKWHFLLCCGQHESWGISPPSNGTYKLNKISPNRYSTDSPPSPTLQFTPPIVRLGLTMYTYTMSLWLWWWSNIGFMGYGKIDLLCVTGIRALVCAIQKVLTVCSQDQIFQVFYLDMFKGSKSIPQQSKRGSEALCQKGTSTKNKWKSNTFPQK